MLFVNNIGEVVHTMVDRYGGAANKNIGDAFLLVWKVFFRYLNIRSQKIIIKFMKMIVLILLIKVIFRLYRISLLYLL